MLINNIDISTFKAMLTSKDIQTANIITYNDWLRNALAPINMGKQEQYKQIKLQFLIEDSDNENALNDISNLVKQFEMCTIKFDDLSYYYDCLIVNNSNEKITNGVYTLYVELKSGYAYKTALTETMDHIASKTVNIPGNQPTPAIVTVATPIDTISLVLTGFGDDPITINNLHANVPVVVDGEACTVLENGVNKFGDTDMWEFPTLQPGANTITSSSANCVINISYKPKYI